MPGRSVVTIGAWSASTPNSPSAPGTSTCSTSPENSSFCGETSSKWKLAIVHSTFALAGRETHTQPANPADRSQDRDVLHLAAGQRPTTVCHLVTAHLDTERTQFDLGR